MLSSTVANNHTWFVVVLLLSWVRVITTPWTAACQASLSFTISQILLKYMSIELVILYNHLIFCHPLPLLPSIFPSIQVFPNESGLCISDQSFRASVSTPVLPKNIQGWFLLGLTFLDSTHKCYHTVCVYLCLNYLT